MRERTGSGGDSLGGERLAPSRLGAGSLGAGSLGAGSLGAGSLGAGSLGAGSLGAGGPAASKVGAVSTVGAGSNAAAGSKAAAGSNAAARGRGSDVHRTRAVYVISVAAELAGMHPQTLRIYERRGLVDPARTVGGSRRYSQEDIAVLRRIQDLTAAGLNIEGVRQVMALEAEVIRLRSELALVQREAREAVERTHRQYRRDLVPVSNSPQRWVPPSGRGGR